MDEYERRGLNGHSHSDLTMFGHSFAEDGLPFCKAIADGVFHNMYDDEKVDDVESVGLLG